MSAIDTERIDERETFQRLQALPNVGPATARDLYRLGIRYVADLRGRDPKELYDSLCALDGQRHDPCVWDVFAAAVAVANGEPARPWWAFSSERKARAAAERSARFAR